MRRMIHIMQGVLIFIGAAAIALFGYFYAVNHYCTDEIPSTSGIYIYTVDESFGQLNQRYASVRGLEIDDALSGRYAGMEDVPDIAAMEGVEQVYLFDDVFFLQDGGLIDRAIDGDMEATGSIPQAVYEDYASVSGV